MRACRIARREGSESRAKRCATRASARGLKASLERDADFMARYGLKRSAADLIFKYIFIY
jgi:hypothetical protein